MSKIGNWILEQEQLMVTHETFGDPQRDKLNEAYREYMLLGYRNKLGSLNDLVCSNEHDDRYSSPHYSRYFAESVE